MKPAPASSMPRAVTLSISRTGLVARYRATQRNHRRFPKGPRQYRHFCFACGRDNVILTPHRRQHAGSPARYRTRSLQQAAQVQQQRIDARSRQFSRSLAPRLSRTAPPAAHPLQSARCTVGSEQDIFREAHQHHRPVPADESQDRLRGDRHRSSRTRRVDGAA